jgi:hypothetical protein
MELGHLLARSCLTCPEASSKVCHDSFCQSGSSVSLPWVIYYEAFCDLNNEPFNVRLSAVYGGVILQMTVASGTTIFKVWTVDGIETPAFSEIFIVLFKHPVTRQACGRKWLFKP